MGRVPHDQRQIQRTSGVHKIERLHRSGGRKTARKAKVEPEKAEEAPKKRGRKPKAEAEPKVEKAPAKRTRKPKEPKE